VSYTDSTGFPVGWRVITARPRGTPTLLRMAHARRASGTTCLQVGPQHVWAEVSDRRSARSSRAAAPNRSGRTLNLVGARNSPIFSIERDGMDGGATPCSCDIRIVLLQCGLPSATRKPYMAVGYLPRCCEGRHKGNITAAAVDTTIGIGIPRASIKTGSRRSNPTFTNTNH
jgi:hypothetical protein